MRSLFIIRIRFATEGLEMLASKYVRGGKRRPEKISRTDAQQGDQGDTDEGNAAASHELLHALALY